MCVCDQNALVYQVSVSVGAIPTLPASLEMKMYDSTEDTKKHIQNVRNEISRFNGEMLFRGLVHDQSKLESPEKEHFDRLTPILKDLTYGSEEYKAALADLKPALDHHYSNNSHHPEYYHDGIDGMSLFDIVEMYCDWKAAIKRTKDGSFLKSLELNRSRFKMTPQLYSIFLNTHEEELRS